MTLRDEITHAPLPVLPPDSAERAQRELDARMGDKLIDGHLKPKGLRCVVHQGLGRGLAVLPLRARPLRLPNGEVLGWDWLRTDY
jgi:hypothetical protein